MNWIITDIHQWKAHLTIHGITGDALKAFDNACKRAEKTLWTYKRYIPYDYGDCIRWFKPSYFCELLFQDNGGNVSIERIRIEKYMLDKPHKAKLICDTKENYYDGY